MRRRKLFERGIGISDDNNKKVLLRLRELLLRKYKLNEKIYIERSIF